MGIMVIVGDNGKIIWSYGIAEADASFLQEMLNSVVAKDEDFHVFTNFPIFCPNPEIKKHIHCFPGANQDEIVRQRELHDVKLASS